MDKSRCLRTWLCWIGLILLVSAPLQTGQSRQATAPVISANTLANSAPYLVKDINTYQKGFPSYLTKVGDSLLFVKWDVINGNELWISDGTASGTGLLVDLYPGQDGSEPDWLTEINGTLFFKCALPSQGRELCKSDGTPAGTGLVKEIVPGSGSSSPKDLTNANGVLYFVDEYNGSLWKSDGTEGGTEEIWVPDLSISPPTNIIGVDGSKVYFAGMNYALTRYELYVTDGTPGSATLIKDINPMGDSMAYPTSAAVLNGYLYFSATDGVNGFELWRTDGTSGNTTLFKEIIPGSESGLPTSFWIKAYQGELYFLAGSSGSGFSLWKTNGSSSADPDTVKVADLPGNSYSELGVGVSLGKLFFHLDEGSGFQPWISDGTPAGTKRLKDINPSPVFLFQEQMPMQFTPFNGLTYFTATDIDHGNEIWVTDGTEAGTQLVMDINPGKDGSRPRGLTEFSGSLYFIAGDQFQPSALWKIVAANPMPVQVVEISNSSYESSPSHFAYYQGKLFFNASSQRYGYPLNPELWYSDGTAGGTGIVKDYTTSTGGTWGLGPKYLTVFKEELFMSGDDGVNGYELMVSDGTEAGTLLVKNINPNVYPTSPAGSDPGPFTVAQDKMFFSASDTGNSSRQLWVTDGTEAGTVKILAAGSLTSPDLSMAALGSKVIFANNKPWVSDGTEGGTFLLKEISPSGNNTYPSNFTEMNGKIYFCAYESLMPTSTKTLWVTDGTSAGTVRVKDTNPGGVNSYCSTIVRYGDRLLFTGSNGDYDEALWISDGTTDGTVLLKDLWPAGITPGGGFENSSDRTPVIAGKVFFFAYDGNKYNLWESDGTADGTKIAVENINGKKLIAAGDRMYFILDDGVHGVELWMSDGTPAGTMMVQDLFPGAGSSNPANLLYANSTLYFSADDGMMGTELWAIRLYQVFLPMLSK